MGLDISHDAFSGAYSSFNRFRQAVCKATGGSFPPHKESIFEPNMWYLGDSFSKESHPGLWEFLAHSDCDGELSADMCKTLANELEELLPEIEALGTEKSGHLARVGSYADVTRKFVVGCRMASEANEPLEFD